MARTTDEIKKTMTDAFLADETLREAYGLSPDSTWSSSFSTVSLENIILYVVAACVRVLEVLFDGYKDDVDEKVESAVVASVPWYHKKALEFQYGDSLILDESTFGWGYEIESEAKRVIKYVAVRDKGTSVQVLVSGDSNGTPTMLSSPVMSAFKAYMDKIKLAGVVLLVSSYNSDHVKITANIDVDPLVINSSGMKVGGSTYPVQEAINEYLANILYGGVLNKTKLVDAIQAVEGVEDVTLVSVQYKPASETGWTTLAGNNYSGLSGSYVADDLNSTLTYVV